MKYHPRLGWIWGRRGVGYAAAETTMEAVEYTYRTRYPALVDSKVKGIPNGIIQRFLLVFGSNNIDVSSAVLIFPSDSRHSGAQSSAASTF